MATIFSKIISGEIPAYKILEDDNFLAFLDIFPLSKGHTIVIPKTETDYYFDLADKDIAELNIFAKKVAIAIKKAIPCRRIATMVIGIEVPHAHLHLIPFNSPNEVNMKNPKIVFSKEEFEEIANSIRAYL